VTTWLERFRDEYVRSHADELRKPRIREHLGHYLHIELRPHEGRAVIVCGKCGCVLAEEAL
jgi:hypothetical protein